MGIARVRLKQKPVRVGSAAVFHADEAIEARLTVPDRNGETYQLFRRVGRYIEVARELAPVPPIFDQREPGKPVSFSKTPSPRPYQIEGFDQTLGFLSEGLSGVVHAPTAWGKTALGAHVIHGIGRKTLVIVTKDDVFKQWVEDLPGFLGIDPKDIGVIRGPKCQVRGKKVVVAMIHSLSKEDRYPLEELLPNDFGLLITDEVQRLPAEEFQRCAWMFPALLRLGLTADKHRPDGRDLVIDAHIGPVRYEVPVTEQRNVPRVIRLRSDWKCPRVFRDNGKGQKVKMPIPHEIGKTAHIEKFMIDDEGRNSLLADCIVSALSKKRQVVFFTTANRHLDLIRDLLVARGVVVTDIGYYIHASTKKAAAARELAKAKPVVLTNYKMSGEGTNVLTWDTVVLGIPRAKAHQAIGRIRRELEGKLQPVVVDIVDEDSFVFRRYAVSRLGWYNEIGAEVIEM